MKRNPRDARGESAYRKYVFVEGISSFLVNNYVYCFFYPDCVMFIISYLSRFLLISKIVHLLCIPEKNNHPVGIPLNIMSFIKIANRFGNSRGA